MRGLCQGKRGEGKTESGEEGSNPARSPEYLTYPVFYCRAAMQGVACFDGLAPLRDHLVDVELLDVTLLRGAAPGLGPAPAAAIAQSLSRVLRPERLTIRATPGGPSPMLMHGAEGPGPALEFGAMLMHGGDSLAGGTAAAVAAAPTLEEGELFTRLQSLEVRTIRLRNLLGVPLVSHSSHCTMSASRAATLRCLPACY